MKRLALAVLVALAWALPASAQPVPPGGLRKVTHDATLTGAGTLASALGLAPCGSAGETWIWNGSAFACGTAAVVTPIGRVKGKDGEFTISGRSVGPTTLRLRSALLDIQRGAIPDPYGWIELVD